MILISVAHKLSSFQFMTWLACVAHLSVACVAQNIVACVAQHSVVSVSHPSIANHLILISVAPKL